MTTNELASRGKEITDTPPSPKREATQQKRIPSGIIFGEIPLEACKAYPIHIWQGLNQEPRIAYADFNTHQEKTILSVKLLPNGGKTAPHPQIVFFVNGPYHVETLRYNCSNAWNWTTWMEFHLDTKFLKQLISTLTNVKLYMEYAKT